MAQQPDLRHVDVRYVAALARLALTDAEVAQFQGELDAILGYVAQLGELDLDGVEPMTQAMPRCDVMRDDVVEPSLDRTAVLANAPAVVNESYLRVPAVLEEASGR